MCELDNCGNIHMEEIINPLFQEEDENHFELHLYGAGSLNHRLLFREKRLTAATGGLDPASLKSCLTATWIIAHRLHTEEKYFSGNQPFCLFKLGLSPNPIKETSNEHRKQCNRVDW